MRSSQDLQVVGVDHGPLIDLMREARSKIARVRKVLVASAACAWTLPGPRRSTCKELVEHHVGGT
jgi:hypothetical protein